MQRSALMFCVFLLLGTAAQAQSTPNTSSDKAKKIAIFDASAMDKSVDPCSNFYLYACGNWLKNNSIPSDQPAWGRFNELHENNQLVLRGILEKRTADSASRGSSDQKIGDYYYSCMDEAGINAKGTAPLHPTLDRISALGNKSQLPALVGNLHNSGIHVLFEFGSEPDAKNSVMEIAGTDQGGLGLPDRDYYLKTDDKSVALRKAYELHITNMFKLLGESQDQAAKDAATVMKLETELAKASMDRVERRDPNKVYHKMSTAQLQELSPAFTWKEYFATVGSPSFDSLDVSVPDFVKGMNQVVANSNLDEIKTYLRWQTVHRAAPLLPEAFVDENFDFYGKTLTGAKEIRPRWKRCVQFTNGDLGEALGKAYVAAEFPPESKAATLKMVHELEAALKADITQLSWMTDTTKKQALDKLAHIDNKIGYPDKWRDYSTLQIIRGDALGNGMRANEFEFKRQLNKIGKPVDRMEWGMTPPTVNAYYNPQENNINFPAGILQSPFYDPKIDAAVNFGAIGAVIGHELTHGFDDQGSQYDAQGNLSNWWTAKDREQFDKLESCFVNEYDGFVAVDDVHVRGKLTLGENTADNGGLRIAHMALLDVLANNPEKPIDSFTPEQRLFVGWGQIWCENERPEFARMMAQVNEHSPGKFRVNGVVGNMPEFQKAFGCKAISPMIRKPQCRVW
ncbi:MAG: M13 family metallopeptidase [Acidobacteriota bacterium]|nr:M13 family metallopeptidase [Acidobacteriota bacterium]